MNEIMNYEEKTIRVAGTFKEPWFCGKDICTILGYSNTRKAVRTHVDDADKSMLSAITEALSTANFEPPKMGGSNNANDSVIFEGPILGPSKYKNEQKLVYINESGLYSLILSSKLDTAKMFKRWVTSEVLPSIRSRGIYQLQQSLEESKERIKDLVFANGQMLNFVTNVKTRSKKDYIYILSTTRYASHNNFKIGHSENLKTRLATYNTGQASSDLFYYCYTKKVFEAQKLDKLIHDLLIDFRDSKNKENVIMHFTYLTKIIDFVADNFNESFEFLNSFIKNDLALSHTLRPVIPEPIKLDTIVIVKTDASLQLISDLEDGRVYDMLHEALASLPSPIYRKQIFSILETEGHDLKGYKRKIWELLKTISFEKKLNIKYWGPETTTKSKTKSITQGVVVFSPLNTAMIPNIADIADRTNDIIK